jgi:hypothetical protein
MLVEAANVHARWSKTALFKRSWRTLSPLAPPRADATEVAMKMWTTKSAVSRLESGCYARPNLDTIEKYALAVGARVEIRGKRRLSTVLTSSVAPMK